MTGPIEWTPAAKVVTPQLGYEIGEQGESIGSLVSRPRLVPIRLLHGDLTSDPCPVPIDCYGPVLALDRIAVLGRSRDDDRSLGKAPSLRAFALDALGLDAMLCAHR